MKTVHICVFGASITWGAFDTEKGGWADRLRIYFFNQEDDNYASVYNLGVSGATTNDLLERLDAECEARGPDIIVFSIGNNDSQLLKSEKRNRTTIEKFQENLEKLHRKASKYAKKIIFVGLSGVDEEKTSPVYWDKDAYYSNEEIGRYDAIIENFCKEKKLKYINLREVLTVGDWEDGLHPNARGHEKIFQKIYPDILGTFQEFKN